ncbi:MAG TPA: cyclase family protein [Candidatus Sulfotelmatobacter sp.]|nr:cyclase family protein [Candidatus Sulfotelmatobacter sp.]
MRIRSFIIAYALVLAILLFADRRPGSTQPNRYSRVVDLTDGQMATPALAQAQPKESGARIIAPAALIPGTWTASQIPADRLIAPLVVMDLNPAPEGSPQISLDDIAAWESRHGVIPQGAVVAIRRTRTHDDLSTNDLAANARLTPSFPIARDAAEFLIDARYTIGFAVETPVDFASDRNLARQLALHGSYVVEDAARFTALPATGSLIIVAPAKKTIQKPGEAAPVRILAMVR